jgi:hypothetical protein
MCEELSSLLRQAEDCKAALTKANTELEQALCDNSSQVASLWHRIDGLKQHLQEAEKAGRVHRATHQCASAAASA